MATYRCPFCDVVMPITYSTESTAAISFEHVAGRMSVPGFGGPHLKVKIFKCPNCEKESVIAYGVGGYCENQTTHIFPKAVFRTFPDYIPAQIRKDYEEAYSIVDLSPNASATLARRCLQGMIRDFWGIVRGTLYDEISAIKDKVTKPQWAAIDALRKIGNIGAHMEKDTSLILDIESNEAKRLLSLIELLMEKWYITRHDEEQLLSDILGIQETKNGLRKSSPVKSERK